MNSVIMENLKKFKKKLLKEINALHVEGLPEITRLNALVRKYDES